MKKLFMFMAAALMTFSLASCDKKDKNEPETPAAPVENKIVFEAAIDATYASMGFLEVYGMSSDEAWAIDWYLFGFDSFNTTLTDDNLYQATLMKIKDGKKDAEYAVSEANLKASINEEQTIWTIAGTFTANEVKYTVEIAAAMPEPADPYEWDESESDYAEDFATYTVDDKYLAEYGDIIVLAENEKGGYVALDFYVPETAEGLVAGEYTVSDSEEAMTVYAGEGDGEYLYYSFASYMSEEGISQVWFLVSGKVTVNADGSIVVDAVNSNGKKINCTLAAPASDGGEKAPAKKVIRKAIKEFPAKKHAF